MPTLANDLVRFLMHLFGSREAIQEFLDDPAGALEEHGLGNVGSADVDAAMPVVLDYAPIHVNASSFDREHEADGNSAWAGYASAPAVHVGVHASAADYDHDDYAQAVQQLHHMVNRLSYAANAPVLDDRDAVTDQSANQNIWAHGDVEQWFDNDAVVASGAHAVSGGDVSVGNAELHVSGSFNTDVRLDAEDSFNDDPEHSTSTDVGFDLRDSFNDDSDISDSSTHNAVDAEDSFNQDNSTSTAVDLHVDDSFQDHSATDIVEDNLVVADNQLDFREDSSTHSDVDLDNHGAVDGSVVDDSTLL